MKITAAIAALLVTAGAAMWWRELIAMWPLGIVFAAVAEFRSHLLCEPRTPLLRLAAGLQWLSAALRAFALGQRVAIEYARYEFPGVLQSFRQVQPESPPTGTTLGAGSPAPSFSGRASEITPMHTDRGAVKADRTIAVPAGETDREASRRNAREIPSAPHPMVSEFSIPPRGCV